jgi:hypothetical protein
LLAITDKKYLIVDLTFQFAQTFLIARQTCEISAALCGFAQYIFADSKFHFLFSIELFKISHGIVPP